VQQILESHIVENEVGAPLPAKFDLPSYRHHRGTALVALLGASAGFVAASCLDFAGGTAPNPATKLEVWMDHLSADGAIAKYAVESGDVHVYPGYNPSSFANNLAVIQFNKDTSEEYTSLIQTDYDINAEQVYVQRTVDDAGGKWHAPAVSKQVHDSRGCLESSPLYADNIGRFACTGSVARSVYNRGCGVSYGSVYVDVGSRLVLAGLHSHTLVFGGSTCGDSLGWVNYYTLLGPYAGFAVSVLNRPVDIYRGGYPEATASKDYTDMGASSGGTPSGTTTWKVIIEAVVEAIVEAIVKFGVRLVAALFVIATIFKGLKPGTCIRTTDEQTDSGDGNGLSTVAKIIIGVVVPMGVIIIVIAAVIGYHVWRTKRRDKEWNPHAQAADIQ
ncbi:hypothetical protein IWQ56_004081, partial [Coemansia nantahalensis]